MISRKNTLLACLVAAVLFPGCAPIPMIVDLSGSEHLVKRQVEKKDHYDYRLVVLNRAPETKSDINFFGADMFPMKTEEKPKDTLEKDIINFFNPITSRNDNEKRIIARIDKADASWSNPGVNKIPFVGLITVWAQAYRFEFDISVVFEVEENGKVLHSYPFAQNIVIEDGDATTQSGIEKSYQRIISMYRKMMFDSLELEFIPRYLSRPVPPREQANTFTIAAWNYAELGR